MRSPIILRVASLVTVLYAAGHTLGGRSSWSPPGETEVLRAMNTFRFDVAGLSRSYLEFYVGFGLVITVYFLAQAVLLWQLATLARTNPPAIRPLVATLALANAASAVVSWRFVFAVPVVFSALIAALLASAFYFASHEHAPAASAT